MVPSTIAPPRSTATRHDQLGLISLPQGEIAALDACSLTTAFDSKSLSPTEVALALLKRIEASQTLLSAYSHLDPTQTLNEARRSEARMMRGQRLSPLDGVPISFKASYHAQGWPATKGSRALAGVVADKDDEMVARVRALGAVVLGLTSMPDLGYCTCSISSEVGPIRNPWDLARTTGGSSAGAGAAAAAGLGPVHFGADGYGSIRLPAAWTGTLGFLPGSGKGLLTRSVGDVALMFEQMGPHVRWHSARGRWAGYQPLPPQAPFARTDALALPSFKGLRLAYLPQASPDSFPAEASVMAVVEAAVAAIASADGIEIERLGPVLPAGSKSASAVTAFIEARNDVLRNFSSEQISQLDTLPRELTARAAAVTDEEFRRNERAARAVWDDFTSKRTLEAFDMVLTPSVRIRAFRADRYYPEGYDAFLTPHGLDDGTSAVIELGMFNLLGGWSCFSLPCGYTTEGLPVGLQVAVRPSPTTVVTSMRATAHIQQILGLGSVRVPFA